MATSLKSKEEVDDHFFNCEIYIEQGQIGEKLLPFRKCLSQKSLQNLIANNLDIHLASIESQAIFTKTSDLKNLLEYIAPIFELHITGRNCMKLFSACSEIYRKILTENVKIFLPF